MVSAINLLTNIDITKQQKQLVYSYGSRKFALVDPKAPLNRDCTKSVELIIKKINKLLNSVNIKALNTRQRVILLDNLLFLNRKAPITKSPNQLKTISQIHIKSLLESMDPSKIQTYNQEVTGMLLQVLSEKNKRIPTSQHLIDISVALFEQHIPKHMSHGFSSVDKTNCLMIAEALPLIKLRNLPFLLKRKFTPLCEILVEHLKSDSNLMPIILRCIPFLFRTTPDFSTDPLLAPYVDLTSQHLKDLGTLMVYHIDKEPKVLRKAFSPHSDWFLLLFHQIVHQMNKQYAEQKLKAEEQPRRIRLPAYLSKPLTAQIVSENLNAYFPGPVSKMIESYVAPTMPSLIISFLNLKKATPQQKIALHKNVKLLQDVLEKDDALQKDLTKISPLRPLSPIPEMRDIFV